MKLLKYTFLCAILLTMSCKDSQKEAITEKTEYKKESATKTVALESVWKTNTTLTTSEGVCYDATKNVIYVSNIGAVPPNTKDGDGTLSIIDTDGKIMTQNWITGLNAPKGITIYNGKLYVADINEVIKVDIETGIIDKRIKIEASLFLNDVDVDASGTV
ncbi:MAG: hypothetical protein QNK89_07725 [Lacinutrix sp.]|uniref:hypothetical protein n=1 Tax=Lacinutrix sp. TaxID=1937692 RepID=UPI0030A7A548